uniref:Uncharacterized protein n=1 Tax=viral metagenome TaxID=1070528 RepID=A0A6M3K8K9_9ZZZZ
MSNMDHLLAKRPTTVVLTTRCDMRTLASLALWWREQGDSPRSTSELVRISLEMFADIVLKKYSRLEVEKTDDAEEILARCGMRIRKKNRRHVLEQLQLEDQLLSSRPSPTYVTDKRKLERPFAPTQRQLEILQATIEKGDLSEEELLRKRQEIEKEQYLELDDALSRIPPGLVVREVEDEAA